ncbi:MAG: hypothetical protein KF797_05925 [Flavobacteriales bacterium]|nr:hypothetical protein [Flavobacteriales bacterium]
MRSILLITAAVSAISLSAQTKFPALTGETASGKTITLPTKGKPWTVIGLAYSQKASPLLEEWYEPAYLRFIAKHGLMAGSYEADVYFVPLFVGLNKAAYEGSMNKFRKSADPEIVDHVLFSKAEIEPLKEALDLKDKDIPYFFVLDAEGRVVHREKGAFTDDKLESIEEVLMD